jgi:hypothetical protein
MFAAMPLEIERKFLRVIDGDTLDIDGTPETFSMSGGHGVGFRWMRKRHGHRGCPRSSSRPMV